MFGGHNLPPTHSHLRFLRRHHFIFGISIAFRSHTLLNPSIQLKYYFVLDKNSQQMNYIFYIYLHLDLLLGQQNKNKFRTSRQAYHQTMIIPTNQSPPQHLGTTFLQHQPHPCPLSSYVYVAMMRRV